VMMMVISVVIGVMEVDGSRDGVEGVTGGIEVVGVAIQIRTWVHNLGNRERECDDILINDDHDHEHEHEHEHENQSSQAGCNADE